MYILNVHTHIYVREWDREKKILITKICGTSQYFYNLDIFQRKK